MGKHFNQVLLIWILLIRTSLVFSQAFSNGKYELIKLSDDINSYCEESKPLVSSGGDSLFFVRSYYPENMGGESASQDIWISKKVNNEWSTPINDLNNLNDDDSNLIIGFTSSRKLYTIKYIYENEIRYAIVCISPIEDNHWTKPTPIDLKPVKVGEGYHDFYVHPSEKVILISMRNIDSIGEEDIYIIYQI